MFIKMVYPPTGQTAEADKRAFEKVWKAKGWKLVEKPKPEPSEPKPKPEKPSKVYSDGPRKE